MKKPKRVNFDSEEYSFLEYVVMLQSKINRAVDKDCVVPLQWINRLHNAKPKVQQLFQKYDIFEIGDCMRTIAFNATREMVKIISDNAKNLSATLYDKKYKKWFITQSENKLEIANTYCSYTFVFNKETKVYEFSNGGFDLWRLKDAYLSHKDFIKTFLNPVSVKP